MPKPNDSLLVCWNDSGYTIKKERVGDLVQDIREATTPWADSLSDEEIIDEFVIVNWAWFEHPETGERYASRPEPETHSDGGEDDPERKGTR